MTKFIELTESYDNDRTERLILNVSHIVSFKISDRGNDTHLRVIENKYFFVKETVQQILDMLNMTDEEIANLNYARMAIAG